jgi:hypothetical protein
VAGGHLAIWRREKLFLPTFLQCLATNVYTRFAIVTSLSEAVDQLFAYNNLKWFPRAEGSVTE